MIDDLKVLFPGRDIIANTPDGQETIHVTAFYFGQYPRAVQLMKPLADILNKSGIMRFKQQNKQVTFALADDWPMKLPEIMADGGEVLISFMAFAIKKPREWFDTLPGDDGIAILQAIFEENASFFRSRIQPMLLKAGLVNPQGGEQSLPASSAPATEGETSTAIH